MERTPDEETCKRVHNLSCTRTNTQVEHSQDALRHRMNMRAKQQVSSQTVGESKSPWKAILLSMHRKFGKENR